MPYLKLQTNRRVDDKRQLISEISGLLATILGKPEKFIMIAVEPGIQLHFGGSDEPAAFVELKSIGLPADITPKLSRAVCTLLEEQLDIPADRVYIEFSDAKRNMFGWNKGTFEK
jgi:phenylpyruvate tautomerase PptA (4-oxalocrotonate tautomerase family)